MEARELGVGVCVCVCVCLGDCEFEWTQAHSDSMIRARPRRTTRSRCFLPTTKAAWERVRKAHVIVCRYMQCAAVDTCAATSACATRPHLQITKQTGEQPDEMAGGEEGLKCAGVHGTRCIRRTSNLTSSHSTTVCATGEVHACERDADEWGSRVQAKRAAYALDLEKGQPNARLPVLGRFEDEVVEGVADLPGVLVVRHMRHGHGHGMHGVQLRLGTHVFWPA